VIVSVLLLLFHMNDDVIVSRKWSVGDLPQPLFDIKLGVGLGRVVSTAVKRQF